VHQPRAHWLTDSVEIMRSNGKKVIGYRFEGKRYDIGTFESLLEADRLEQFEDEKIHKKRDEKEAGVSHS